MSTHKNIKVVENISQSQNHFRKVDLACSQIEQEEESLSQISKGTRTALETSQAIDKKSKARKLSFREQEQQKLNKMIASLSINMMWALKNLRQHLVHQRSIYFVLDTYFEQYKQLQMCKDLIVETFRELDDDDYFGLLIRHGQKQDTEDCLDIQLEEKSNNVIIKEKMLAQLNDQVSVHLRRQDNNYMKLQVEQAMRETRQVRAKQVSYHEINFQSPIKWIICFIGTFKGLNNLSFLSLKDTVDKEDRNTNILLVFLTDEQPDKENFKELQEKLRQVCDHGGVMIIRYRDIEGEDANYEHEGRQLLMQGFKRVKSAIATYPGRTIPIIQEELAL